MEDVSETKSSVDTMPGLVENSEVCDEYEPQLTNDDGVCVKVNGDKKDEDSEGLDSSDCDNLVIDEVPVNRKRKLKSPKHGFKGFKKVKGENVFDPPTNPYFNESIFELSELHKKTTHSTEDGKKGEEKSETQQVKKGTTKKKKNSKLREYAQYLGLQPAIQFKCSKCGQAGFPSLLVLNDHHKQCTAVAPVLTSASTNTTTTPSTNFRVTRKVFLCSACGTYYENWNLFLHMREVHKRFICLYCLGMFSLPEKLSLHLISKHNCVPNQINTEQDFFEVYKEPCFLMCCECEQIFNESENFFDHHCLGKPNKIDNRNSKAQKNNKVKPKAFVEHVTADTTLPSEPEAITESTQVTKEPDDQVTAQEELPPHKSPDENRQQAMETDETSEPVELNPNLDSKENDLIEKELSSEDDDDKNSSLSSNNNASCSPNQPVMENSLSSEMIKVENETEPEETRRVPKVTLKLPKSLATSYVANDDESDDSDRLTLEVKEEMEEKENEPPNNCEPQISVAGSDVPITELELEQPLDKFDTQILLQKCLKATIPTCVYCNHARKIAVNGKQLGLHAISEHRFSAVVNSITAEELIPESFVVRIKEGLHELENVYFNIEATNSEEGVTFSHVFECFQCRYATTVHKELYLHNRKMHAKTILLCIMCKSNFYSYSELICHLCPGIYELNNDVNFRCCMCVNDDLPSAFRLMVHFRKRHNACDVCLELCNNQSKLSNHVWKHKLHHLCYRCGIAYRNKPDITKHLFWKHGTESVLCKKCLQKKWPHVYHFCIPPTTFACEECGLNFTRAVALKVHKRLHGEERPHVCTFENCNEKFISKKLLLKHEFKHREPPEELVAKEPNPVGGDPDESPAGATSTACENPEEQNETIKEEPESEDKPKTKPKVDVYDLPELNLSESDSSDSEDDAQKTKHQDETETGVESSALSTIDSVLNNMESDAACESKVEERSDVMENTGNAPPVLENIWDDFKNYQANKEKLENFGGTGENSGTGMSVDVPEVGSPQPSTSQEQDNKILAGIVMRDHDYSLLSQEFKPDIIEPEPTEQAQSMDHDYCSNIKTETTTTDPDIKQAPTEEPKPEPSSEKKPRKDTSSSNSSDDSDSSSCTCGSNCSCSSSSNSSSSSSDSSDSDSSSSEGRRKQQLRRERRKQRAKNKKESESTVIDVVATDAQPPVQVEQLIQESDLDTTETETDEDFYDKQPQKLASKLLAEKRKELLLAEIGPVNGSVLETSRPSTPNLPEPEVRAPKKKSKNKKKKKKSRKQDGKSSNIARYSYQPSTVSPLTISLPKSSPLHTPTIGSTPPLISASNDEGTLGGSGTETSDFNLRASKRRRIPNRFYGYSSDEENEKHQPPVLKWRKADLPSPVRPQVNSPLVVPPITIKTVPAPVVEENSVSPRIPMVTESARIIPPGYHRPRPVPRVVQPEPDSGSDSNDSSSDEEQQQPPQFQPPYHKPPPYHPPQPGTLFANKPNQPPLYCYCRCPYDEVSEMIGCDSSECLIEWFHFECVGIMVPPKGQWFCPDCRKKKQQRKELLQA